MRNVPGIALSILIATFFMLSPPAGAVPLTMNYQGVLDSSGEPFSGSGEFRFVLVDDQDTYLWTQDGSPVTHPDPPDTGVTVNVQDGLFNVILGRAPEMQPIPPSVFMNDTVFLRVWLNDGVHGLQQLTPDRPITSVGYSIQSRNADTVDGQHYDPGWETSLTNVITAAGNDFHNLGGIDDDVPDSDAEVPDAISIDNGLLYAPAGASRVGIATTSPQSALHVVDLTPNDDTPAIRGIHAETDYYGIGVHGVGGWRGVEGFADSTQGFVTGVYGSASGEGTGTRYGVYATASGGEQCYSGYFDGPVHVEGAITVAEQTRYLPIAPAALAPHTDVSYILTSSSFYPDQAPGFPMSAYASVSLPDGATITGLRARVTDTDPAEGSDLILTLHAYDIVNGFTTPITSVSTSGTPGTVVLDSPTVDYAFDAETYVLALKVEMVQAEPAFMVRFHVARITYTVTEPLP
ncbi:MAG TPA: hypothetical protein PLV45_16985 [bacterium]|nr:hypothetical protein [bacterium]